MAQFEIVFWVGESEGWGKLEVEADYYRDIEKTGKTEFIHGPAKSNGTNVVLSIDTEEVLYVLQKPSKEVKVEVTDRQLEKFYSRYPQAVGA